MQTMTLTTPRGRVAALTALLLCTALVQAVPQPASAAATRYEAESATIVKGAAESNHSGYSGTGFVNGDNVVGSYVEFTVTAASAGTGTIAIRYSNGTADPGPPMSPWAARWSRPPAPSTPPPTGTPGPPPPWPPRSRRAATRYG